VERRKNTIHRIWGNLLKKSGQRADFKGLPERADEGMAKDY